ncbi:MAG: glycosyltransferase [Ignavibacteria bacterium]|jgi:glycosyltransferase involved in cell wall biosynthesis
MIKILELIDGGFIGGGQIHILSLTGGLNKTLFNPVIAAAGRGKFEETVNNYGIPFVAIYQPKILRKKYLKPLLVFCEENNIDVVHSHGGVSGFYGRMVKKHYPKIKTVHTIHGIHYINTKNYIRKFISQTVEQYLVQYTDCSICLTKSDLEIAKKIKIINPDKTSIVPNGINLNKYKNLQRKNIDFLSKLNLNPGDFIVGNVSRFDFQKNQNLIVKAAARLIGAYPGMKFVLVGDGKLLESSKKLAKELKVENNVLFIGEKLNLIDFYSIFDVFVFPTFWEGMPYVLLEAMACRLPIICSDIPSLKEIVKDNYSALLINPYNEIELCDAIIKLYNDKKLMEEISSNAHEKVKNYSEYFTVKKIEEIYTEVMSI